jgi:hypothetical protein
VAELVDAADSKSAVRKGVKVRFLSWAQGKTFSIFEEVFCFIPTGFSIFFHDLKPGFRQARQQPSKQQ